MIDFAEEWYNEKVRELADHLARSYEFYTKEDLRESALKTFRKNLAKAKEVREVLKQELPKG